MDARLVMFAVAMLAVGTAAVAEPPKAPAQAPPQQANYPAKVMLASADQVATPAPADQSASQPPKRPRAARVTTCRCGDQSAEQPEQ